MVTFWNLKWWFLANFRSSPGAAVWRSRAWSSWLVSRPMLSTIIWKRAVLFSSLKCPSFAWRVIIHNCVATYCLRMKNVLGASCAYVNHKARLNLFWRIWEHFVWGHNSTVILLYCLSFIQLQVTENQILIDLRVEEGERKRSVGSCS